MHEFWVAISSLGESRMLVPAALVAMVCIGLCDRAGALKWLQAFCIASVIVLTSKLAFLGWGYGLASIDFTGFSGHAMVSAAIYPVVGYAIGNVHGKQTARRGTALAVLLVVLIGASRLMLGAHSPSEVGLGLLAGGLVSGFVLLRWPHGRVSLPLAAMVPAFLLSWAATLWVAPQVRTHDAVVALALALSGEAHPYTRADLHLGLRPPV
jgi:membrane-associated phospholipid phosphatase